MRQKPSLQISWTLKHGEECDLDALDLTTRTKFTNSLSTPVTRVEFSEETKTGIALYHLKKYEAAGEHTPTKKTHHSGQSASALPWTTTVFSRNGVGHGHACGGSRPSPSALGKLFTNHIRTPAPRFLRHKCEDGGSKTSGK